MFEVHITIPRDKYDTASHIAAQRRWKMSRIEGDPLLGDKVFAYLTRWDAQLLDAVAEMNTTARILRGAEVPVLRQKIEVVVFDLRSES